MREDLIWWASVLTGRSDITTVDYRILHRDTIKKALVELDTLNDAFRMEVVQHKRGRKVEELQFRVIPKSQPSLTGLDGSAKNVFDLQLVERIVNLGMKRPDAQDLYATTDEGALRAAVERVEQRMKQAGLQPLASPVAYLRDALKKGYAGSGGGDEPPAPPAEPPLDEKLRLLRDEWEIHRSQEAREHFDAMDDATREQHLQRFIDERLPDLPTPIARAFKRDGVRSRVASGTFFRWLAAQLWPEPVTDTDLLEFALTRDR
jgi:hypothetical protein